MKNMMSNYSFNIVCTTIGRESLPRLIDSFKNQLTQNDSFTIISDTNHEFVQNILSNYNVNDGNETSQPLTEPSNVSPVPSLSPE